ncbi:DUF2726 domain-containing protein [Oceanisphaera arctica]|uniref:DUF2726 domain-containing protein n=1 Tax=Oceanisphaera arctica TaxID=641510 RepID=A0A2P5TRG2_9GAMM|nr:DUF2726 domain-containing protein [Oceanisphaera arctica]PPL18422.1 hypothetical protein UN63_00310 [Oceanisphaera arctica]GHA24391.1 hypothetical protein GCM10007082_26280 [Oceanisphaera arctica]
MTDMLPVSLLDWLMFSLVLLLILLVLFVLLRRLWRGAPKQPYQQKLLFSPESTAALQLLDEAIGAQLRVFAAVSLSELLGLNPKLKKAQREQAWHDIYGEKMDFVLCSPKDLRVRAVVALIDDSLSKTDGRQRQLLLQHIQDTGLPVIHLSPKEWPTPDALHDEILATLKQQPPAIPVPAAGQGRVEPVLSLPDEEQAIDHDEPRFRL